MPTRRAVAGLSFATALVSVLVVVAMTIGGPLVERALARNTAPAITLSPTSGTSGTTVEVRGSGFPAGTVQVTWDGDASALTSADAHAGSFVATFSVGATTLGAHLVSATAERRTATATAAFTIVATPPSASATPSATASPSASPTDPPSASPTLSSTPSSIPAPTATPLSTTTLTPAPTATRTAAPTTPPAPGTRITWQGSAYYLSGANVPWFNWACDFGCGPNGGVSSELVRSALDARLQAAAGAGLHTIRFWAFEGDAWQITRDPSGAPAAVNAAVYADFDAALSLAAKYDLYYDFVLFSAPTAIPLAWQTDSSQRARLASALAPLFARYATNPHVLSWEIYNEPDFDVWNGKIAQSAVVETARVLAAAVHANSGAYATVGTGYLDGLPMFVGIGLDYYESHWYDYMSSGNYCAICTDYATVRARYGLDRPLVIGELYIGADTTSRFETFYAKGYAGAWPWSLFPDHTSDHLAIDLTQAAAFSGAHTDVGPR